MPQSADVRHARQVIFDRKGCTTIEAVDLQPIKPDEVLVESRFTAISPGTELATLQALPTTPNQFPLQPGYSGSGVVVEVGSDVSGLAPGDRVVAPIPHASAWIRHPDHCLSRPAALSDRDAAMFRLASIALQGVRKAQVQLGESALVIGLGVIGNLAGQLIRAAGAARVVGLDTATWRAELAQTCGFDQTVSSTDALGSESGEGFDVVIDATGVPHVIPQAFALTRRMGRTVLLGTTRGNTADIDFCNLVHRRGLTVLGAHETVRAESECHRELWTERADNATVLTLMESGRIHVAPLVSDTMSGAEAPRAYERLLDRKEQLMTIILDWA